MTEKFFIGPNFKARIQDTIRFVESMPARVSEGIETTVLQEINQPPAKTFRVCTFTGAWSISEIKNVRFIQNTNQTAQAVNLFANITAAAGDRPCAIAKEGTAWYLIAARC